MAVLCNELDVHPQNSFDNTLNCKTFDEVQIKFYNIVEKKLRAYHQHNLFYTDVFLFFIVSLYHHNSLQYLYAVARKIEIMQIEEPIKQCK